MVQELREPYYVKLWKGRFAMSTGGNKKAMKSIRIYLIAVMFFTFSSVYARADEKQGSKGKSQASNVTSNVGAIHELPLLTQDLKLRTQDSSNIQVFLPRYIDSLNKWVSLSFEKEKSGIYFSMAF